MLAAPPGFKRMRPGRASFRRAPRSGAKGPAFMLIDRAPRSCQALFAALLKRNFINPKRLVIGSDGPALCDYWRSRRLLTNTPVGVGVRLMLIFSSLRPVGNFPILFALTGMAGQTPGGGARRAGPTQGGGDGETEERGGGGGGPRSYPGGEPPQAHHTECDPPQHPRD